MFKVVIRIILLAAFISVVNLQAQSYTLDLTNTQIDTALMNGYGLVDSLDGRDARVFYDDLRFPASNIKIDANNTADATSYLGSEILAFPTNKDARVYFAAQLPHAYIEGEDIEVHIHYALSANGTNPDSIRWAFTYTWANINGALLAPTTVNVTDLVSSKIDSTQYLLDFGDIDGTDKKISSMLLMSLMRDVSEDDYTGAAYLMEVDIHYPTDGRGSRQETVK